MEKLIDLHTHTTASDGSMKPSELVNHAHECGLVAVAITDHDTVDGIAEGLMEAQKLSIDFLPGVEIGVEFKPEMHILGYFRDDSYVNIGDVLLRLRKNREERNPRIINKLNEMGLAINFDEVEGEAMGAVIGRPHIAKVLIKKGYVKSIEEAFDKYLSYGRPAYFKKDKLTPEEGIGEIVRCGGLPVLAHPVLLGMSPGQLDKVLGELTAIGLKGVEAYYTDNTIDYTGNILRLAAKHKLLSTGGSDFHGSLKPDIEIGKGRGNLRVPYEVFERLMNSLDSKSHA